MLPTGAICLIDATHQAEGTAAEITNGRTAIKISLVLIDVFHFLYNCFNDIFAELINWVGFWNVRSIMWILLNEAILRPDLHLIIILTIIHY